VKALILLAVILINIILYTARADEPVGRFQLVPATVETSGGASISEKRSLFKIDTVTGQTWQYVSIVESKKGLVEKWIEIEQ
jgi:hypothetical protein